MKPRFLMISGILTALMLIRFQVSAQTYFTAEVKGKGKPIILIHGLYCSGEVWTETVERYQKDYECHILTLSGFGGNEARLSEHFLQSVKDDVIAYVKKQEAEITGIDRAQHGRISLLLGCRIGTRFVQKSDRGRWCAVPSRHSDAQHNG